MYIILLGAPGAGKGTQAVMMAEKKKLVQVASGDLFRKALQQETELGKKAKVYMEKGQLVPNEITIQMVLERLTEPDCKDGAILDGFPRNLEQAKALDKVMGQKSRAIDKVVYIKVSEGELLKRLGGRWICRKCQAPYHEVDSPPKVAGKCDRCGGELYQRADDNVVTVKKRLEVYFKETSPLIDYYKRAGKLLEINGEGSAAEVNQRIAAALR
ncbi:MAG: adenylate kinase [Chloroflexi bacterium RBG_13_51_18]|nr:MAG: adenylate kinase [Chloroflexi bacterium RBG_13_51_18]